MIQREYFSIVGLLLIMAMVRYERVYIPSYLDKHNPKCPDCDSLLFYVGDATYFREDTNFKGTIDKTALVNRKLCQCSGCRKLFQEVEV